MGTLYTAPVVEAREHPLTRRAGHRKIAPLRPRRRPRAIDQEAPERRFPSANVPDLDAPDLDAADAPFRGDAILVADPTPEGAAIADALRMRGFMVIELSPEHLDARAIAESPRAVVVDIDHPGAIEAVERLRELSTGAHPELFFLGDPVRAAELGATRASGRAHARPVDVDAVIEAVARIAQIGLEDDAFGTLPPPSPPQQRQSLLPHDHPSDASLALSGMPSSSDPFDVAAMLDEGSSTTRSRSTELSPELALLLDAAEQRVLASGQPSSFQTPEEELDLLLPPELLAVLDEPIDPDDEPGGTGSDLGTAAPLGAKRPTTSGSAVLVRGPTEPGRSPSTTTPLGMAATPPSSAAMSLGGPATPLSSAAMSFGGPATPISSAAMPLSSAAMPLSSAAMPLSSAALSLGSAATSLTIATSRRSPTSDPAPPRPPSQPRLASPEELPPAAPSLSAATLSASSLAASSLSASSLATSSLSASSLATSSLPASSLATSSLVAPRPLSTVPPPRDSEPPPARTRRTAPPLSPPSYAAAVNIVPMPPSLSPPVSARVTDLSPTVLLNEGDAVRALARAVAARTSGSIAVGPEAAVRRIVLRDGDVVTAASSADDETLVAFLAARGDLDRDAAARLSTKLPPGGRHAGAALIAHGYLGQDDLWPVLRAHAEWIIGRALLETTGAFELEAEPPGRLKAEPGVFGGATGAEVLVEAIRRVIPPETALKRLGGLHARIDEGQRRALLAECALRREEEEAVRLAPGRTLAEILDGAPGELCDVFYALVSLGVLDVLAPVIPAATSASAKDTADPLDQEAIRLRVKARMALVEDGDYFALLGVPRSATGYEVRRAYLELRRAFEPARVLTAQTADLATDVKTIVEVLDEAYEILREPNRRERYRKAIEAGPP
jgi:hypothetical protein